MSGRAHCGRPGLGEELAMQVSVIVPVYNGEHTLRGCLDALGAEEASGSDVVVLLADCGSTDGTWELLNGYGAPIRGLQETSLRGSYAARNTGIAASRGEIVAFGGAVCVPDPHWL